MTRQLQDAAAGQSPCQPGEWGRAHSIPQLTADPAGEARCLCRKLSAPSSAIATLVMSTPLNIRHWHETCKADVVKETILGTSADLAFPQAESGLLDHVATS